MDLCWCALTLLGWPSIDFHHGGRMCFSPLLAVSLVSIPCQRPWVPVFSSSWILSTKWIMQNRVQWPWCCLQKFQILPENARLYWVKVSDFAKKKACSCCPAWHECAWKSMILSDSQKVQEQITYIPQTNMDESPTLLNMVSSSSLSLLYLPGRCSEKMPGTPRLAKLLYLRKHTESQVSKSWRVGAVKIGFERFEERRSLERGVARRCAPSRVFSEVFRYGIFSFSVWKATFSLVRISIQDLVADRNL